MIVIEKWLYEEQLLLGLFYTHFFLHMPVPMFDHQADFILWLFFSHCLLIELMGSPQPSFMAHSVLWTLFVTIFLSCIVTTLVCFLCFHFAAWVYNLNDHLYFGEVALFHRSLCSNIATWVYNSIDHPSLGQCPMHSALWYCTILFDI